MTLSLKDNPPHVHPQTLLEPGTMPDAGHPWWVGRTRTRQEKALARSLHGKGIGYFLPLVSRPQKNRDRMRTSIVPLFDGYLFFQADAQERLAIIQTGHLAQALPVKDQDALHAQLQAIAKVCEIKIGLELADFAQVGKKVRIIAGPFTGLTGTISKGRKASRLILKIDAIGQAVAVEISLDQVQPE